MQVPCHSPGALLAPCEPFPAGAHAPGCQFCLLPLPFWLSLLPLSTSASYCRAPQRGCLGRSLSPRLPCLSGLLQCGKRKKPKPKAAATTLRLRASAYADAETRIPAHPDPSVRVPGLPAGFSSRPATSTAAGSRSRHPYTSFDSVTTHRTLQAEAGWPEWKFVTHAITTSTIPGGPVGRTLRHKVRGYPAPQVAIMAERRFDPRRTIVFDARDVEGPLVVYDVRVTTTTALLASLLDCSVNGVQARPDALLDANADVVLFSHSATLLSSGPAARPPTPPIPALSSEEDSDNPLGPSVSSTMPLSMLRWQRSRAQGAASARLHNF